MSPLAKLLVAGSWAAIWSLAACSKIVEPTETVAPSFVGTTEPPPPPIGGRTWDAVEVGTAECGESWFVKGLAFSYLKSPNGNVVLLSISTSGLEDDVAVSPNARIMSVNGRLTGVGSIRFLAPTTGANEEVLVDLSAPISGSLDGPPTPGEVQYYLEVPGQLGLAAGGSCPLTVIVTVVLNQ